MPNWKKIVVSGSNATLNSLFISNAVTASIFSGSHIGPLTGTASWSMNAINTLTTASVSSNTLTFTKGDGTTFNLTVNTGSGGGGSGAVSTYTNGVDNRVITATGAAGINGEANLTFDGTVLNVSGSAIITGSLTVRPGAIPELQVTSTGVNIGNAAGDTHRITGSVLSANNITAPTFNGNLTGYASGLNTSNTAAATTYRVPLIDNTTGNAFIYSNGNVTYSTGTNVINVTASYALNSPGGGGVTINNNTDNYVVTATGTANTLNGESSLTYDGTTLISTRISTNRLTISNELVYSAITSVDFASSPYSVGIGDSVILVDTTGGDVDLDFTSVPLFSGYIIIIKDVGGVGATNKINLNTITIDNGNTTIINTDYGSLTIIYDGSAWWSIGKV